MLNRRIDTVYLVFLLAALAAPVLGYAVFNEAADDGILPSVPDFETPALTLEAPFDFPYAIPSFESRSMPSLRISDDFESVLVEVRSALLSSATPVEVEQTTKLAAAVD